MALSDFDSTAKWHASFMAGILFFILAMPFTFQLTDSIFRPLGFVTYDNGPTMAGLVVHSVVYLIITRILMA